MESLLTLGCLGLLIAPSCQQVPKSLFKQLSNITNVYELADNLLAQSTEHADPLFVRPGSVDQQQMEIIAGSIAQADMCSPRMTSTALPPDPDPNVVYFPSCVLTNKCGGCGCGHGMLECVPEHERVVEAYVMRMRYPHPGSERFNYEGMQPVELVEHTGCTCRCRVQRHHCNMDIHIYRDDMCQCECMQGTQACPSHQVWNNDECRCVCPRKNWCLQGEYFSEETCRCEYQSSFVKIVDEQTDGACAHTTCRAGYRPVPIGDSCPCRLAQVSGVMAGSLQGGLATGEEERLREEVDKEVEEVIALDPTRAPAPARPTRPRRPRPGAPIRQTGSMVPGG